MSGMSSKNKFLLESPAWDYKKKTRKENTGSTIQGWINEKLKVSFDFRANNGQ